MLNIHKYTDQIFDSSGAYVYCKCTKGNYLAANKGFLDCNNFSNEQELIGSSDYDIVSAKTAALFQKNDNEIVTRDLKKTYIECHNMGKKSKHYLSYKMPLRCVSGKILGVFGLSIPLEELKKDNMIFNMLFSGLFQTDPQQIISILKIKNNISHRQAECLYYLSQGKTMKEIAVTLNLSLRTIEYYVSLLKNKLNSFNRSQLIESCFT